MDRYGYHRAEVQRARALLDGTQECRGVCRQPSASAYTPARLGIAQQLGSRAGPGGEGDSVSLNYLYKNGDVQTGEKGELGP